MIEEFSSQPYSQFALFPTYFDLFFSLRFYFSSVSLTLLSSNGLIYQGIESGKIWIGLSKMHYTVPIKFMENVMSAVCFISAPVPKLLLSTRLWLKLMVFSVINGHQSPVLTRIISTRMEWSIPGLLRVPVTVLHDTLQHQHHLPSLYPPLTVQRRQFQSEKRIHSCWKLPFIKSDL